MIKKFISSKFYNRVYLVLSLKVFNSAGINFCFADIKFREKRNYFFYDVRITKFVINYYPQTFVGEIKWLTKDFTDAYSENDDNYA